MGRYIDELETIAKSVQAYNPGMSWTDAYDHAASTNPDVYAKAVNEPADFNKLKYGRDPAIRAHNVEFENKVEATLSKRQLSDQEDALNDLAKRYQEDNEVDFYTAYDAVAKVHPELYERAVNEGVTYDQYPYLKMLQNREAELDGLSREGNAVDQGVLARVQADIEQIRSALGSGVFTSEPRIMEAMRKVESKLGGIEVQSMDTGRLYTALCSHADVLSDHVYEKLDDLISGESSFTKGDNLLGHEIYESALEKLASELGRIKNESQVMADPLVKWLEGRVRSTMHQAA